MQNFTDEELYQRDKKSDYTVVHALCASGMDEVALVSQFQILGDKKQLGKVVAKNRKGNVPLQSAIESKAGVQTIEVILNYVPGTKKIMLKNRNKYNETALEQSLVLEHPGVFKFLLKECISCGALEDLTCIGKVNRRCSTVVHQCIRNRRIAHFCAFMEVCKESNVKGNLCALNKKGYTPWEYLMRYTKKEMLLVKEVFSILDLHDVAVGTLTVNTNEETMLHRAYRTNNVEFKDLLEGKYEVTCDGCNRKPLDRSRVISNQNATEFAHQFSKTTTQSLPIKTKLSPCQLPEDKKERQPECNQPPEEPGNVLSPCQPQQRRMQSSNVQLRDSSSLDDSDSEHFMVSIYKAGLASSIYISTHFSGISMDFILHFMAIRYTHSCIVYSSQ